MKSKRIICSLLAFLLLTTTLLPAPAFADAPDFSTMPTEEIQAIIAAARAELLSRQIAEDGNIVLIDQDGIKLYLTGEHNIQASGANTVDLFFEAVVINDSDAPIQLSYKQATVNGWNTGFFSMNNIPAGTKTKATIGYRISDAGISTFEEVEEIATVFYISNASTWQEIFSTDLITITF